MRLAWGLYLPVSGGERSKLQRGLKPGPTPRRWGSSCLISSGSIWQRLGSTHGQAKGFSEIQHTLLCHCCRCSCFWDGAQRAPHLLFPSESQAQIMVTQKKKKRAIPLHPASLFPAEVSRSSASGHRCADLPRVFSGMNCVCCGSRRRIVTSMPKLLAVLKE